MDIIWVNYFINVDKIVMFSFWLWTIKKMNLEDEVQDTGNVFHS